MSSSSSCGPSRTPRPSPEPWSTRPPAWAAMWRWRCCAALDDATCDPLVDAVLDALGLLGGAAVRRRASRCARSRASSATRSAGSAARTPSPAPPPGSRRCSTLCARWPGSPGDPGEPWPIADGVSLAVTSQGSGARFELTVDAGAVGARRWRRRGWRAHRLAHRRPGRPAVRRARRLRRPARPADARPPGRPRRDGPAARCGSTSGPRPAPTSRWCRSRVSAASRRRRRTPCRSCSTRSPRTERSATWSAPSATPST